jgi:hypothetical protein
LPGLVALPRSMSVAGSFGKVWALRQGSAAQRLRVVRQIVTHAIGSR